MASRSLGVLTVDLVAKVSGFEQGMDRAYRTADKRMKEIENRARKFGTVLGTALAAGAGIAAAALIASTKAAIDNADAVRDLSVRLGASTELLSAYGYAASQTGTDIDTLGKGLRVLAKNAADAQNETSEQAKIFEALGIAVTDSEGKLKNLSQLVPQIADKFAQLEDGTTKAALAQALFGRAGGELTEFLNSGAAGLDEFTRKAEELGIVIDQDTANAADQFNDKLGDLKAIVAGVGLDIAAQLLPALNDAADSLKEMAQEGDLAENVVTVLSAAFRVGVGALEAYNRAVQVTSAAIETVVNASAGFAEIQRNIGIRAAFDEGSIVAGAEKVRKAFEEGDKALERIHNRSKSLFGNVQSSARGPGASRDSDLERRLGVALSNPTAAKSKAAGKSDAERDAERLAKAYESTNARLAEQITLFGKTGEAAKLRYELEFGELSKLTDAQKLSLITQAEQLDQMELMAELEKAAAETVERETEAYQQRNEDNEQLIKDMQFELELLGMTNTERERAIALSYLSADATDAQRQAVSDLSDQLKVASENSEFMEQTQRDLANGFADFITGAKSASEAFGDFADSLFQRSAQLLADRAIDALFDAFSGTGGTGGTGDALSSFFSAIFGGGKANGGWAAANTVYEYNERGFETATVNGRQFMLTGNSPVQITPNHMLGGGGGSVTQQFYTMGRETRETSERKAQIAGREASRALARTGR